MRAFEAATLFALRKALRNGSVWVAHSQAYCRRNAMLIPDVDWEHQRQRWYQHLSLPLRASSYTPQLLANLEAEEVPPDLEATKQALFKNVGVAQLPTLLMAIDHETRFS